MPSLMRPLGVAVLGAACLLAVPAAQAQSQSPGAQSQTPQTQSQPRKPGAGQTANISDQKLDQAAVAIANVANLSESYQRQIDAASPDDRPRIANEANAALEKAVTDQGLSVEEYNQIIKVAQNDPVVYDKILQRLRLQSQ